MVSLGFPNVATNKENIILFYVGDANRKKKVLSGASEDTFLSVAPEGIKKKKV